MNCLKCPNYWQTNIDENKSDQCGCETTPKESEGKDNEQKASGLC